MRTMGGVKVQSHRHGHGKYARDAWGSRADCKECSEYDARMEKARQHYARETEKAAEYVKDLKVDSEGLIEGQF